MPAVMCSGGRSGNDVLRGGIGNDRLVGDNGNDTLKGGRGDDTLLSVDDVGGSDVVNGNRGDDTCFIDRGDDAINCEAVYRVPLP
jgi:Ca2+-binding RTX toxin-like protein